MSGRAEWEKGERVSAFFPLSVFFHVFLVVACVGCGFDISSI